MQIAKSRCLKFHFRTLEYFSSRPLLIIIFHFPGKKAKDSDDEESDDESDSEKKDGDNSESDDSTSRKSSTGKDFEVIDKQDTD